MSGAKAFLSVLALGFGAAPAAAVEPIDAAWPEVARVQDGDCLLTVTGNGRFYRIAATGLGSEAPARFVLANGDMKPLDWSIRAANDGGFARYYLPFRWHRSGDQVRVAAQSARCDLTASFAWKRAEVVVR